MEIYNQELLKIVEKQNPMKEWLVDYVGTVAKPENNEVTVNMIVDAMAKEFPEFLLAVAEENFIRGYQQAFKDLEANGEITPTLEEQK
jgi:hypothetical protein